MRALFPEAEPEAVDEETLNRSMDRYACGDQAAFADVHRALHPRLQAFLMRITGSSAAADDLVQETFLRMHRARSTFSPGAAVVPWAYAIARNVHLDHVRASKLRKTERLPSDPGQQPRAEDDAEASAVARQAAARVESVLSRLPAAQREAFVLLRYEGLSVQDAAAVLGATPTAVKLRAFRAYEALRAELADLREGGGGGGRAGNAGGRPRPLRKGGGDGGA